MCVVRSAQVSRKSNFNLLFILILKHFWKTPRYFFEAGNDHIFLCDQLYSPTYRLLGERPVMFL